MRWIGIGYYDPEVWDALTEEEQRALGDRCAPMDEEFRATGQVLSQASLAHREGAMLRPGEGGTTVTDGPFAETKEVIGSFFVIEAETREEAVRVASLHPAARMGREMGWAIQFRPIEMMGERNPETGVVEVTARTP